MSTLALLDDTDLPWVTEVIDVVAEAVGQPWRVALERLDDTGRAEQPRAPVRFAAVVAAVQRVLGGRVRNAAQARVTRSLVLGAPTLSAAEREARIAYAARELQTSCAAIEKQLWSDLPRERPVELPRGRPSEFEVAAYANVQLLQRAMRRAQSVTLRIWGDAGPLLRGAALRGLLTTVSLAGADTTEVTVIEIVGPLALFHRTAVYGKALADLAPLLADVTRFELEVRARARDGDYTVEVSSPVLLPSVPARLALGGMVVARLCKELQRRAREAGVADMSVTPQPAVITSGRALAYPDLAIEYRGRRTYVEILGFWTIDFVRRKLARYRDAGIGAGIGPELGPPTGVGVIFCVDESRGCTKDELPDNIPVLCYSRRATSLAAELIERTCSEPAGLPRRLEHRR